MNSEENVNEELKGMAPEFPKKNSMEPPSGYFEKFPDQVLNRWQKEESHTLPGKASLKRIIAVAAVIAALCVGGWWYFTTSPAGQLNTISAAEAYQYVQENIDEFESLIDIEDIKVVEVHPDVPKEEIEEFLFEETGGSDPEELF
jgi:hypothetical protein